MDEMEFKSFDETYRIITWTLSVSLTYPNPGFNKYRIPAILLMIASAMPTMYMITMDMFKSWENKDYVNVIRHTTVLGPLLAGFSKMIMMRYRQIYGKKILDEITSDYHLFNDYSEKNKDIARTVIRESQIYSELAWSVVVFICSMSFPFTAIVLNIYNFLFKSEPVKYMVHDIKTYISNSEPETRFDSPYFEIIFAHMCYCACILVVTFIGYDALFGISINHACLKMNMYCAKLEDAMTADSEKIYSLVVRVIKEQCRTFKFVDLIQNTFDIWLSLSFIATMTQICFCLYQVNQSASFDVKYMIFVLGVIAQIFLPCSYASKLKETSLKTADKIYSCGWENINNRVVKQMIIFMIARAQVSLHIMAYKMVIYNMGLFVTMMQTSYSMFTLLRS